MTKPIAIDLCCGLGGWAEGLIAAGYEVRGYDIERHDYGTGGYPGMLIIADITTLHGSAFKDAALIVGSPPCQAYSYRAMPWRRAKALPPPDNTLFETCFRLQREASEAAGRYIPMVIENVRGAQPWVGRAKWHYGSFYLWGDVPALMPIIVPSTRATKNEGGSWFAMGSPNQRVTGQNPEGRKTQGLLRQRDGHSHTRHLTNPAESDGVKQAGISGPRANGKGDAWFQDGAARHGSKSISRKESSALIAKIPFPLALHIAQAYKPAPETRC